ncbi:MAG: NTP transferase domain-containing protein [Treponema sp.]|jgi:mannose-1-phosphate guanylyltransferase/mannose-1-phosphate guanylyltransferase/mannose-6-phosphate isomerase|nr:NTP transferase domain-containing protein [Treponema sp.]
MFDYCIIMAGGSGTRLWPLSNSMKPKQFLPVPSDKKNNFFTLSLERAFSLINGNGEIIIVAGKTHVPHIVKSCADRSEAQKQHITVIPEPEAKNTAAAIACALVFIEKTRPERNGKIFVLPSDHLVEPKAVFTEQALLCARHIDTENLAVFGIPPAAPETGFGYIEINRSDAQNEVAHVVSFHEKPDTTTAEQYLASGNFYWNSGMFAFSSGFMKREFRKYAADCIAPFEILPVPSKDACSVKDGVSILEHWEGLTEAYTRTRKISFDFAVVTKSSRVIMSVARFKWRDIGCWDEYASLAKDVSDPSAIDVFRVGSANTVVDSDIPVALCEADDLIVVIRSGKDGSVPSVLIAKKGETQKVGSIVEQMKMKKRDDLL